jgi:hypothetical protein
LVIWLGLNLAFDFRLISHKNISIGAFGFDLDIVAKAKWQSRGTFVAYKPNPSAINKLN